MVYRIFVEKKDGLANEAVALCDEINSLLFIKSLEKVRLFNRYDVENIEADLFEKSKNPVFSEPQTDVINDELPTEVAYVFAVEYLPGQ